MLQGGLHRRRRNIGTRTYVQLFGTYAKASFVNDLTFARLPRRPAKTDQMTRLKNFMNEKTTFWPHMHTHTHIQ